MAFTSSSNTFSGLLLEQTNRFKSFIDLKEKNLQLLAENAELKNLQNSSFIQDDATFKFSHDSAGNKRYRYTPAEVINNSVYKKRNFFTLNKGSKHGIKQGMVIATPEGVAGIISSVSRNYSTAISLLNTKLGISGRLSKNNYYGSVVWDGTDYRYITLNEIPNHVEIETGDIVVTSGYSALFPEGYTIGEIVSKMKKAENNFFEIRLRLSVDFKNLRYVYIIENLKKEEVKTLEKENDKY